MMTKGLIYQKYLTVLNMHTSKQSFKAQKIKMCRTKRKNKQGFNYSWKS